MKPNEKRERMEQALQVELYQTLLASLLDVDAKYIAKALRRGTIKSMRVNDLLVGIAKIGRDIGRYEVVRELAENGWLRKRPDPKVNSNHDNNNPWERVVGKWTFEKLKNYNLL